VVARLVSLALVFVILGCPLVCRVGGGCVTGSACSAQEPEVERCCECCCPGEREEDPEKREEAPADHGCPCHETGSNCFCTGAVVGPGRAHDVDTARDQALWASTVTGPQALAREGFRVETAVRPRGPDLSGRAVRLRIGSLLC